MQDFRIQLVAELVGRIIGEFTLPDEVFNTTINEIGSYANIWYAKQLTTGQSHVCGLYFDDGRLIFAAYIESSRPEVVDLCDPELKQLRGLVEDALTKIRFKHF